MTTNPRDHRLGVRPWRSLGGGRRGFTLTELTVVIVIIGILPTFILKASMDGVRRSNELATQALIQKLDEAMSERMEALMSVDVEPNATHRYLANVYSQNSPNVPTGTSINEDRARVIARYDFVKSEVPDVFFYSPLGSDYLLNFAAQRFPGGFRGDSMVPQRTSEYVLPLGAGLVNDPSRNTFGSFDLSSPGGTGIVGASYSAAAGIYKNLGFFPTGYDGVDNDGNGLIDDLAEGVTDPATGRRDAVLEAQIRERVRLKHTHNTARSEMLYAVLVEGVGPLGAAFAPDDFSPREVADTDGDGLPEFIDAWGEPLQFFRWPIFHRSDVQRGYPNSGEIGPYFGLFEEREQNPLDPDQQLVNPAWILTGQNISNSSYQSFFNSDPNNVLSRLGASWDARISRGAWLFQNYFHTLIEPLSLLQAPPTQPSPPSGAGTPFWDRTTSSGFSDYTLRRSYFTKFLIVSSGPDRALGIGRLGVDHRLSGEIGDGSGAPVQITEANLVQIENAAASIDPNQWNRTTGLPAVNPNPAASQDPVANQTTLYLQFNAGIDDISNHKLQAAAGSKP